MIAQNFIPTVELKLSTGTVIYEVNGKFETITENRNESEKNA